MRWQKLCPGNAQCRSHSEQAGSAQAVGLKNTFQRGAVALCDVDKRLAAFHPVVHDPGLSLRLRAIRGRCLRDDDLRFAAGGQLWRRDVVSVA